MIRVSFYFDLNYLENYPDGSCSNIDFLIPLTETNKTRCNKPIFGQELTVIMNDLGMMTPSCLLASQRVGKFDPRHFWTYWSIINAMKQ